MCGVQPSRYDFHRLYFPFDSAEVNSGGGFADVLEILPGRFGGEAGALGAGMGVEPVSHFGLVFGGGVFVTEYVGYLAFFTVVRAWDGP